MSLHSKGYTRGSLGTGRVPPRPTDGEEVVCSGNGAGELRRVVKFTRTLQSASAVSLRRLPRLMWTARRHRCSAASQRLGVRVVVLACAALAYIGSPVVVAEEPVPAEPPLLGASLSWTVHRDFRQETRELTFSLRTAWAFGPGQLEHFPGDLASVKESFEVSPRSGQRFGMLCFWKCRDEDCADRDGPADGYASEAHCVRNDFTVQAHNKEAQYTAGNFSYTLQVAPEVVSVLAYLSFAQTQSSLYQRYRPGASGIMFSNYDNRDWSSMSLKASGATMRQGSFEECKASNDFCATKIDCPSGACGAGQKTDKTGVVGKYGGGEYFGQTFLDGFKSNGEDLFGLAATFVQLCCSTASCRTGLAESKGCASVQTNLKNYYSPVISFPLALFQGRTGSAHDVKLKVSDYDGHMLRLLPIRAQNPEVEVAKIDLGDERLTSTQCDNQSPKSDQCKHNLGDWQFHDYYPVGGPVVRVAAQPATAEYSANNYLPTPESATRSVLEVQDYLWSANGIEDASEANLAVHETAAVRLGVDTQDEKPTATGGGGTVQVMFSTYFQDPSTCPAERIPKFNENILTEIECLHDQSNCYVALEADVDRAGGASSIDIIEAPGFERIVVDNPVYRTCEVFKGLPSGKPEGVVRWNSDPSLCADYDNLSPCGCCSHRSTEGVRDKKCRYNQYHFGMENVGEQRVMCFVATAKYCTSPGTESEALCLGGSSTCFSQPLCVRFNIIGHKPTFVAPTPLSLNSADAFGRIVPGRTDVPACLGYPLQLTIKATDLDSGDQVRIFVDDEIRATSFFSDEDDFAGFAGSCGDFKPFNALRVGQNAGQKSIVHLKIAEKDSTITAELNPNIRWGIEQDNQTIRYTLSRDLKNGIDAITECDGTDIQTCRQQLLNMDRIICGYAYDNSRSKFAKWVGRRANPNQDSQAKNYSDDHSLGSYATHRHCWRIKLQAPPVFVTNSSGCLPNDGTQQGRPIIRSTCTPFTHRNPGFITDTTGNRMAYANITLSAMQELDLKFLAFDPNPEDRVQLFVMEDPGIPPNMIVGRSTCEPRAAETVVGSADAECSRRNKKCGTSEGKSIDKCECSFNSRCNPGAEVGDGQGAKCAFCDDAGVCNQDMLANCQSITTDDSEDEQAKKTCCGEQQCVAGAENDCACTGFCPADLECNRASLRLTWKPDKSDFGKNFFVCVTARDNSNLCKGQEPPVAGTTERGWYGEQQCMYLDVVPPAFELHGPWLDTLVKGTSPTNPYAIFIGCTFSADLLLQETSIGAEYGGVINRSDIMSSAKATAMETDVNWKGEKKLMITAMSRSSCPSFELDRCYSTELSITPRAGSEGFYFQLCFSAGDQLGMVQRLGICGGTGNSSQPCNVDSDCGEEKCLPLCIDLRVEKCRYCVKDGPETLRSVMAQYMIDTNWMRLWTLNADTFGRLQTDCPQYFDCDQNVSAIQAIDNPELIVKARDGGARKRILWTGVLYNPLETRARLGNSVPIPHESQVSCAHKPRHGDWERIVNIATGSFFVHWCL